VQMVGREPVLQAVVDTLKLPISWETLKTQVSAGPIAGTQLIEIRVVDTNPQRAKVLADEIAHQLILQSPTPSGAQEDQRRQFINSQLTDLEKQIDQAKSDIEELQKSIANEVSARRIQDIQNQIAARQTQLNIWQTNYSSLLTVAKGGANYLSVFEPASVPTTPISPKTELNMLLAASIGLLLAVGAAFLMEYMDDTIKDPDDVQRVLKTSALGVIARIHPIIHSGDAVIAATHPKASISEAYRVLRTNIQFAALGNPATSLLITSAGPQEGKTTTVANLGVTIAQAGKRTLLVDTDLRRPSLHKLFSVPNKHGLTNLLLVEQPDVAAVAQPTAVPNLFVLPSGPQPPNPAELLASKRMDALISLCKEHFEAILYDSPPVLAVADASILAAKIHEVVLVVDAGRTRSDVARRAKETLDNSGAKFLGVALNRLSLRSSGYGYYYYYYYYYSSDGDQRKRKKPQKGFAAWLRRTRRHIMGPSSTRADNNGHEQVEVETIESPVVDE